MNFNADDKGRLTVTVRGRLTEIDKYADYRENSRGYEYYRGTHLNINVTAYDTAEYIFEGTKYRTPVSFTLDCYESVRNAIGNKKSKNPRIGPKQKRELIERCEGKEVAIVMGLIKERNGGSWDLCAEVVLGGFYADGKPLFYGKIPLEQAD